MHTYAQTNVQLLNQLRSEGYSDQERALIRNVYEFALTIFSGLYLSSGKPFIDHLVGTASILVSLRAPVGVVAAGLIHAAYLYGDFGSIRKGVSKSKREQVRRAVGEPIEAYVYRYDRLPLGRQRAASLCERLAKLDGLDRTVLLIRLANELEHHLDLGALYFPGEKQQRGHQRYMESYGPLLVSLAESLGAPLLATELKAAFAKIGSASLPLEPCIRCRDANAHLIAPASYRRCFSVSLRRALGRVVELAIIAFRRTKRVCGKTLRFVESIVRGHLRST